MSVLEALAIVGAGLAAGTVNTVVGSGTLITFPTLVALGYPAVLANVTNTVGLLAGSASGVVAYRRELVGQRRRLSVLGAASVAGALAGAALLLALPHSQFRRVVPGLILVAVVLVVVQPLVARRLARRPAPPVHGGAALAVLVGLVSVYGGYFGAAQSVIYLALLGSFLSDGLQRLNAAKNVLALLNAVAAAVVFVAATHVAWAAAGLLALGAALGGQLGGILGRRLAPALLRVAVVAVGLTASALLLR